MPFNDCRIAFHRFFLHNFKCIKIHIVHKQQIKNYSQQWSSSKYWGKHSSLNLELFDFQLEVFPICSNTTISFSVVIKSLAKMISIAQIILFSLLVIQRYSLSKKICRCTINQQNFGLRAKYRVGYITQHTLPKLLHLGPRLPIKHISTALRVS